MPIKIRKATPEEMREMELDRISNNPWYVGGYITKRSWKNTPEETSESLKKNAKKTKTPKK